MTSANVFGERICCKCGVELVVGDNVTQNAIDRYKYICRDCAREYNREHDKSNRKHINERKREWNHRTGRQQPISKNKTCPSYIGVFVAERVLSRVFKHVEIQPYGNRGFDFICGCGYKIDVKSSCRRRSKKCADSWMFHIDKNQIADHFLCLALDDRESLNPEYVWLIPGNVINDHVSASVSITRLTKWDEYKLDIGKVVACCEDMRC